MKTPAGKDCPLYYADFHREHRAQECRLAKRNPESAPWHPSDCARCPVPDIVRANASENMRLRLTIKPGIFGIGRHNQVTAYCEKHACMIDNPFVGCPQCNSERPHFDAFKEALENLED